MIRIGLVCFTLLFAEACYAQTPAKTAAEQFKNIQVLKDIPADELIPTMQFVSGALGVECEFCHVEHAMDKDDKKEKEAARKMIEMQLAINKANFKNEVEISCYTCHRGSPHPVGIPILSADTAPKAPVQEHPATAEHVDLPSADQILDKYLAAVGGAGALHRIKSRVQKGSIEVMGKQYPVEIYSEGPERRISISHPPFGDSVTAFNGEVGWLTTQRGLHPMNAQENQAARIDAQLYFPARLRELFQEFHVLPGEPVAGHATYLVTARGAGMAPLRLYFDQQTGFLVRQIRYALTPLGRNPTQIDYADYRDAGGVKIPYQWTLTRTSGSFIIRVRSVQQNVPIDEKFFVMPPSTPPQHP